MRNRWLDFLLTVVCRGLAGAVIGGVAGMIFNFHAFVKGSASGQLPFYLLKWWALVGIVLLLLMIPKENRPWRKRRS